MIQWHFERIGTVLNKSENAGIVLNTAEKRKTESEHETKSRVVNSLKLIY